MGFCSETAARTLFRTSLRTCSNMCSVIDDIYERTNKPLCGLFECSDVRDPAFGCSADDPNPEFPPPDHAVIPPAFGHIPPDTRCVTEGLWRRYCEAGCISEGSPDATRMAFKRAAVKLAKAATVPSTRSTDLGLLAPRHRPAPQSSRIIYPAASSCGWDRARPSSARPRAPDQRCACGRASPPPSQ
jgi:hypothetical protein